MKQRTTNRPAPTPGFATQITDETNLGIALLIAEDDSGAYWPLGPVSTIPEAREFAYPIGRRLGSLTSGTASPASRPSTI
ncbi:MAG TPA: hypothetical protein VFB63_34485 [Bryobacteraceae bacterium]|nr:hypothetical protein [Bryobacteraceae bacterium]